MTCKECNIDSNEVVVDDRLPYEPPCIIYEGEINTRSCSQGPDTEGNNDPAELFDLFDDGG